MRIAFVGAGRWALALALRLRGSGHEIALHEPNQAARERLLDTRRHPDLPASALLPDGVPVSAAPDEVLSRAEMVVFATPSANLATAAETLTGLVAKSVRAVVSVSKGIDPTSLERLSVVLANRLPGRPIVVLAGPGIPWNLAAGDPTSLVAASTDEAAAELVRDCFTGSNLRVYSHGDVAGVELGAAFKNVIALAAGIADGIGLGINAKAALLTRGLAEVTRLGLACNCNPLTFAGLSGMGDLIVTAFSPHSRNHQLGLLIGQGMPVANALGSLTGVAEGAVTARTGFDLGRKLAVELPITSEVYHIVNGDRIPADSLDQLLRRLPKKEVWR